MKYGWRRDLPDQRDYQFKPTIAKLPASVDLRVMCPPVYNQGNLGSCTANAIAGHLDFNRNKQGEGFINPSRLFIYYNERADQDTVKSDSGASIRESVKAVVKYGACYETTWPYKIARFTRKPSKKSYAQAVSYEAVGYLRVKRSVADIKACLAEGYPLVIGFSVYESFDQIGSDGVMPMPQKAEQLLGGHAVMVVGYQDGYWICRNSWSASWGDNGYFYMPEKYLTNKALSSDFWTLRQVK